MPKITIYTTLTCHYCRLAKAFLDEHRIPYTEKDVTFNTELQHEMIHKSGQFAVPVIDIDGEIIVGYDVAHLKERLGIQ